MVVGVVTLALTNTPEHWASQFAAGMLDIDFAPVRQTRTRHGSRLHRYL